jgi:hypothetical protein
MEGRGSKAPEVLRVCPEIDATQGHLTWIRLSIMLEVCVVLRWNPMQADECAEAIPKSLLLQEDLQASRTTAPKIDRVRVFCF